MSSLNQGLTYETTWRCQKNPFIGALGIQEPVIPGEPFSQGIILTAAAGVEPKRISNPGLYLEMDMRVDMKGER